MLREQLIKKEIRSSAFRWRRHENTRIEGLSGWRRRIDLHANRGGDGGARNGVGEAKKKN